MTHSKSANYVNLSPNSVDSAKNGVPSYRPSNTPCSPSSAVEEEELQTVLCRLIREASSTYALGDIQKALSIYDQLVSIDATNNVLFANRSAILLKLERVEEAIQDAKYSIKLKADWPKAHFRLADALREDRDYDTAILSYANSLKLCPESEQFLAALISCALICPIKEDFKKILEDVKAVALHTNPYIIISSIAQIYLNVHDENESSIHFIIDLLEISIFIFDTFSPSQNVTIVVKQSVFSALANAYFLAGNGEKSLHFSLISMELAKESCDVRSQVNLHMQIVENTIQLRNFDIAIFHQNELIHLIETEQMGDLTDAKQRLGNLSIYKGDFESAETIFREILTADSTNVYAHFGVGQALFYMRDYANAQLIFERIEEELRILQTVSGESREDLHFEATLFKCKCIYSSRRKSVKMTNESIEEIVQALNRFIESDFAAEFEKRKPEIMGKAYGLLSSCHQILEHSHLSWKFAYAQLKMALVSLDLPLHADSLIQLSNVFMENGDFNSAIILAEKLQCLIAQNPLLNNPIWRKASLSLLANVHLRAKKYFKAANYFEEFIRISTHNNHLEDLAETYIKIIRIYALLDIQESREKHLNSVEALIARSKDEQSLHNVDESLVLEWEMCWNEELGEYLLSAENSANNLPNAISHFEKALMIAQELEQNFREAKLCEKLGRAHLSMGNSANHAETSTVYFRQFLTIAQQFRDVKAVLKAYSQLSDAYLRMYYIDDALESLKCEVTLADFIGHYAQKCRAMLAIGRILLVEHADVEMALKVFKKTRRLIHEFDTEITANEFARLLKMEFTLVESVPELDDLIRALDERRNAAEAQNPLWDTGNYHLQIDSETFFNKNKQQKSRSTRHDRHWQKSGSKRKSVRSCKSEAGKWRHSLHEETFSDAEYSENGATTEAETVESLSGAVVLGVEFCGGNDDDDGDYEEIEDAKVGGGDVSTFV